MAADSDDAGRLVAQLLGVCRGLICDGVVRKEEVIGFAEWIQLHPQACAGYPGAVLVARLSRILEDGRIDDDEREDLLQLMREVSRGAIGNHTARTCLDEPPPAMLFNAREFVFLGWLFGGTRAHCEAAVVARRGRCARRPSRSTDFVVAGPMGGEDWATSPAGRALMRAVELRTRGAKLRIVSEAHYVWHVARIFPGLASP